MVKIEQIENLVQPLIDEGAYFIVELKVNAGNKIKLVVDKMEGIRIDECVKLSRAIESGLDREVEDFELEVTSPGLDMPLKVRQQYIKNINRELKVQMTDGKEVKGLLLEANDEKIVLEESKKKKVEGSKKKKLFVEKHEIKYNEIKTARIIIKF